MTAVKQACETDAGVYVEHFDNHPADACQFERVLRGKLGKHHYASSNDYDQHFTRVHAQQMPKINSTSSVEGFLLAEAGHIRGSYDIKIFETRSRYVSYYYHMRRHDGCWT